MAICPTKYLEHQMVSVSYLMTDQWLKTLTAGQRYREVWAERISNQFRHNSRSTEAGREFVEDGRNGVESPFHGTRAVNLTRL
jgi:hypothetical protein